GPDQSIAVEPPTRPRRFAPRRSRGAELAAAKTEPSPDPDSGPAPAGALAAAGEPAQQLSTSVPDQGEPAGSLTAVKKAEPHAQPSRPRRDRRPAAPLAAPAPSVGMVTEEVAPDTASLNAPDSALAASAERIADLAPVAITPAQEAVSAGNDEAVAIEPSLTAASFQPADPGSGTVAPSVGAARAARGPGRARPASKRASTVGTGEETAPLAAANPPGVTGKAPLDEPVPPRPETPAKPSRSRRTRPIRPAGAPVLAEEAREEPVAAVKASKSSPSEAVETSEPAPLATVAESPASDLGYTQPPTTESAALTADLADFLGLSSRQAETVGADLDGAELLAKALREMFPPVDPDTIPAGAVTSIDSLPSFDFAAAAAALDAVLDALPEQPEAEETTSESEEAQHRRGRRGRRGGRGRRR